mmetsp:Transcript_64388/g.178547  ORF Transcript_64388/g.178547 Transcript_64388/m.178547 type:complete len:229 (-) Transcript_64388:585-1271(-)
MRRHKPWGSGHDEPLQWHPAKHGLTPRCHDPAGRTLALRADDLYLWRRGACRALRALPLHRRVLGPRRGLRGAPHQRADPQLPGCCEPRHVRHGRRGFCAGGRLPRDNLTRGDHVRTDRWAADGRAVHVCLPHLEVCRRLFYRGHLRLRHQATRLPIPARAGRGRLPRDGEGCHGRRTRGHRLRASNHRRDPHTDEEYQLQRLSSRQLGEFRPDNPRVPPCLPDRAAP